MGFDYNKTRMRSSLDAHPEDFKIDVDRISVQRNRDEYKSLLEPDNRKRYFNFEPSPGWKGAIEI
jgi:hypothetical protein